MAAACVPRPGPGAVAQVAARLQAHECPVCPNLLASADPAEALASVAGFACDLLLLLHVRLRVASFACDLLPLVGADVRQCRCEDELPRSRCRDDLV